MIISEIEHIMPNTDHRHISPRSGISDDVLQIIKNTFDAPFFRKPVTGNA